MNSTSEAKLEYLVLQPGDVCPKELVPLALFWRGGKDGGTDVGRQGADVFEEGRDLPELFILVPGAVGEHAGMADAVFGDPKKLGVGVVGTYC